MLILKKVLSIIRAGGVRVSSDIFFNPVNGKWDIRKRRITDLASVSNLCFCDELGSLSESFYSLPNRIKRGLSGRGSFLVKVLASKEWGGDLSNPGSNWVPSRSLFPWSVIWIFVSGIKEIRWVWYFLALPINDWELSVCLPKERHFFF